MMGKFSSFGRTTDLDMTGNSNHKAHILVVDDDLQICKLLKLYLTGEGYEVSTAQDSVQMMQLFNQVNPALVILDLTLGSEDGLTLARELRTQSDVGIIILTGKLNPVDKVVGLEIGADDYITKPFDKRELLARVRSVLRRVSKPAASSNETNNHKYAHFNGWTLNLSLHELTSSEGENVHLTGNEFQLLSALVLNSNKVLTRDHILSLISGRDWAPIDRSVDVLVAKLRKKLKKAPEDSDMIKTLRGAGYIFAAQVELS